MANESSEIQASIEFFRKNFERHAGKFSTATAVCEEPSLPVGLPSDSDTVAITCLNPTMVEPAIAAILTDPTMSQDRQFDLVMEMTTSAPKGTAVWTHLEMLGAAAVGLAIGGGVAYWLARRT